MLIILFIYYSLHNYILLFRFSFSALFHCLFISVYSLYSVYNHFSITARPLFICESPLLDIEITGSSNSLFFPLKSLANAINLVFKPNINYIGIISSSLA